MRFIFDESYVLIPCGENYIYYFGNLNKAIQLSYLNMYYLKCILDNGSGEELSQDYLKQRGLTIERVTQFTDFLLIKGILFGSIEELRQNEFRHTYDEIFENAHFQVAYLHVTLKCNFYNKQNLNGQLYELTTSEWKKAIDRLSEIGVTNYVVTGGEPLLREDLGEITSYIHGKLTLLTNGTLIDKSKYDLLRAFDNIIVSLDSIDGMENAANRVLANKWDILGEIRNLPEDIRKRLKIRTVITKTNMNSYTITKKYIEEQIGVGSLMNLCIPNSKEDLDMFVPLDKEQKIPFQLSDMNLCGAGRGIIALNANGDIYPCQALIKSEFRMGNVFTDDWKSEMYQEIVHKKLNVDAIGTVECSACVYKYICCGGCKAIRHGIFGNIIETNHFMCEYYKKDAISKIKNLFI